VKRAIVGVVVSVLAAFIVVTTESTPVRAATGMAVPGGIGISMLVDPVHRHVFISAGYAATVVTVADYSAQEVAEFPIGQAFGMALSPDDAYLYVASWWNKWPDSTITKIDTATLKVVQTWSPPTEFCPKWLAISNTRLWMSGRCEDQSLDDGSIVSTDLSLGDFQFGGLSSTGGMGRIAVDPNQKRLVFRDDNLDTAGAVVYDVSGTSIGQPVGELPVNDGALSSNLFVSADASKMLVNASDGSGAAYSGDGASLRNLPDDNPPETLYQSSNPTAAGWTADEQWIVVSMTFGGGSDGFLYYYRTSDPSQRAAQVSTATYVEPGSLVVTPDGALVFTVENPDNDRYDGTLHVYPGPTAGVTSPPPTVSPTVSPTGSPTVAADTTPPTASLQTTPLVWLAPSYDLRWTASDSGSGLASVDVRFRQAGYDGPFGVWRTPWSGVTASSIRVSVQAGRQYCFEVRAHDRAGNVSAWSAPRCLTTPVDDHSLAGGSSWVRRTATGYYLGTYSATMRLGAVLSARDVIERRVAIVASVGPTAGTVAVYVGNKYLGRINLTASRWRNEHVVVLPATAVLEGPLTLRSIVGNRLVKIDGVALLH
jgi:hypothetical protein